MNKEEFVAMDEDARFEWLQNATAEGKSIEEICDELGMTRAQIQMHGYTFALGEWHMLRMSERAITMTTK